MSVFQKPLISPSASYFNAQFRIESVPVFETVSSTICAPSHALILEILDGGAIPPETTELSVTFKRLNEKKQQEQDARDEVTEIRDAVIEVAELVSELYTVANANKESGENG